MVDLSKINTDPTKIDPSKPTVTGQNLQNLLRAEANVGKVGGAVTNEGKIVGGDYGGERAITSDILAPAPSLDLSAPSRSMNDAGALAMANASGVIGATEARITDRQNEINSLIESQLRGASSEQGQIVSEIRNILGGVDTANAERISALQSPEFLEARKASDKAFKALKESRQAQANEIDIINKSNMSDAGRAAALRDVTNKYALQNANLSVAYEVANKDYESALNNINTITQLKIESVQPKMNFYQSLLPFYNSQFTKAEQNIIESKKDGLKRIQEGAKEVSDVYAELLKNNPGAITPSIAQGLSNQPNRASALEFLAKNQVSLAKPTRGVLPAGFTSNDPFIQKLVASAGGKALTDTTIQKLDKGLTVLGQLGSLQENIKGTKTGPLTGAFRGANPWDTNAQTIKAQLNAIVPNLARGIYGEVGVLTDNDIRTYSKTLPNLKSTEEVRNAVLYITLDQISKSIGNTLSVNAAGGRDVSGFTDIYTEMEATKNSILSEIPGAQLPQSANEQMSGGGLDIDNAYDEYLKITGQATGGTTGPAEEPLTATQSAPKSIQSPLPSFTGFNLGSFLK